VNSDAGRSSTTGGIRHAIAAIANVGALSVSMTIGPRALAQFLPELADTARAMASLVEQALWLPKQKLSRTPELSDLVAQIAQRLQTEGTDATFDVKSVLADIDRKGVNARTRLRLLSACTSASERLARVCDDIEILDWAIAEPARVAVGDIFDRLPKSRTQSLLLLVSPMAMIVNVPVRICLELLHQALVHAHRTTGASCLQVTADHRHTVFVRAADFSATRDAGLSDTRSLSISLAGTRKMQASLQALVSSAISVHLREHALGVDCHFLGLDAAADT
jgi:hypothetical protein